jgi:hypothetical protein
VWKTFLSPLNKFGSYPQIFVDIVAMLWIIPTSEPTFSAKYTTVAMLPVDKPVDKGGKNCG